MLKSISFNKSDEKGFSLVELITVIAIIIILTSMLAPAIIGYIDKAHRISAISTVRTMVTAMELSMTEHAMDKETYINKKYKYKYDNKIVQAGCLTSWMLYRAQRGDNYTNKTDYADFVIAKDILEACNSSHGTAHPTLKFKNDTRPVGSTVSKCCKDNSDAAVFVYSPSGGVYFAQVCIKGQWMVTYENGVYDAVKVKDKNMKFVGTDKISGW